MAVASVLRPIFAPATLLIYYEIAAHRRGNIMPYQSELEDDAIAADFIDEETANVNE